MVEAPADVPEEPADAHEGSADTFEMTTDAPGVSARMTQMSLSASTGLPIGQDPQNPVPRETRGPQVPQVRRSPPTGPPRSRSQ